MKTDLVCRLMGGQAKTARFFGISRSAVSQWGEELPRLRVYELRARRPSVDAELAEIELGLPSDLIGHPGAPALPEEKTHG